MINIKIYVGFDAKISVYTTNKMLHWQFKPFEIYITDDTTHSIKHKTVTFLIKILSLIICLTIRNKRVLVNICKPIILYYI